MLSMNNNPFITYQSHRSESCNGCCTMNDLPRDTVILCDSRFPKLSSKTSERWLGYFRCKQATTLKVHIFWEGHKILRNLPLTFYCMYCSQKLVEDFAKFLWPSQNIWTLRSCCPLSLEWFFFVLWTCSFGLFSKLF